MTRPAAARLAWSLWGLSIALFAASTGFTVLNRSTPAAGAFDAVDLLLSAALLAFPTVGALVASRHPGNPIGWIFCAVGPSFGLAGLGYGYAAYALFTDPGSLPGGEVAAWLSAWLFAPPVFLTGPLLFLLFPDGRLQGRRWRFVLWTMVGSIALFTATIALMPGPLSDAPFTAVDNPAGIPEARAALGALVNIAWVWLAMTLVTMVNLVVRFRRSRGIERQQLKWLLSAAALFVVAVAFSSLVLGYDEPIGQFAILLAFVLIPVAVGVAMLRHRLYDIDVVINRALVYGALTAALAGAYLSGVLLLGLVARPLTGSSNLAIAGSTLAVAALFGPARARIQRVVDRRFYRRRYDAARTLESFGARLRDEVDLDTLGRDLRGVVAETLAPAHVSLWLRGSG